MGANIQNVQAVTLNGLDRFSSTIIDVRTQMEYLERRLKTTHSFVPLDVLEPQDFMMRHGLNLDSALYFLCASGKRANLAAQKFVDAGFLNIHVIDGGISACQNAGLELEGSSVGVAVGQTQAGKFTLDRQVRTIAGGLVAVGALLALAVNPLFAYIPLLVGAGLAFSGLTNQCALALILTKAPWNQTQTSCSTGSCAANPNSSPSKGKSCQ